MADNAEDGIFWKVPLPPDCIHFVDSTDSESFSLLYQALRNASLIAMDAEWKPVFNKSPNVGSPRVSILQIACRLHSEGEPSQITSGKGENAGSRSAIGNDNNGDFADSQRKPDCGSSLDEDEFEFEQNGKDDIDASSISESREEGSCTELDGQEKERKGYLRESRAWCQVTEGKLLQKKSQRVEKPQKEIIFLLDLLSIPASAFGKVLKDVLVDSTVLKLGFGFKQDLTNLRSTFPGPDSHCCFDKVEPYLDVGKLYRHLHENASSYLHRGKRLTAVGDGLASIVEVVLGSPLNKDMQCSNWEQRPLSVEQYEYAAADAYCLLAIFDALQVQASDSWFGPVEAEDDEIIGDCQPKVGIAELLCPVSASSSYGYASASIYQIKKREAAEMVEAALGEASFCSRTELEISSMMESSQLGSKSLGIETLVRRFGENLLVTGRETSSKRVRRKTRSRRAREYGKNKELQDEEDVQWVGPPPWDSSLGGDGVPKFLCDAMVEGLARQLRCVGIDAASPNSKKCEPRELVDLAEKEGRILLTRDVKLLRRRLVPASLAYRVKRQGKWDQLAEIIETFKLSISEEQLLTRCTKCNGDFIPTALNGKEAVAQAPWSQVIPECALSNVDKFWQCAVCKHVYWQGYQFTRAYKQFAAVCQPDSSVVQD